MQARHQWGSTLTGFVVGLLIGLGLALSVAVYVTRLPVPFVDRGVSRKPVDDALENERNKGWNPNASLAGKSQTEAAPAAVVAPEAGVVTGDAPAQSPPVETPVVNPKPKEEAKTEPPKPAADPLGDLMKAKAGKTADPVVAPSAAATAAGDGYSYFVQAGAFRSPDEAQAQKARLAMLGMDATVSEREQAGQTVFRVRMGPFQQKSMADATREQLEVNGVEAALVRVQQ